MKREFEKRYRETLKTVQFLGNKVSYMKYRELLQCTNQKEYDTFKNKVNIQFRDQLPKKFEDGVMGAKKTMENLKAAQTELSCLNMIK